MNNLKSIILPTMVFGIVLIFGSCNKQSINKVDNLTPTIQTETINFRVGEDEEEDIILGRLEDSNQLSIADMDIELLTSSDSTITDSDKTDTAGKFELSGPSGNYLYRISGGTNSPVYSASFNLNENIQVTIQL